MVKAPAGHLTPLQESKARRLAGTVFYKSLARQIGSSRSNLMRWARDNGVSLNALKTKPEVIAQVCSYYEKHGRVETQKAFPKNKVRSIVERYKQFQPRQVRWTSEQIIEAARMAGLVSPKAQAKYFNRPNAFSGSIKSLWVKKFGLAQGTVNGWPRNTAKHFVNQNARYIKVFGNSRAGESVQFRNMILWIDIEKNLKREVPGFVAEAAGELANFQRWLHGSPNTKEKIRKMIKDREICP